MLQNVVLVGGFASLAGIAGRLSNELDDALAASPVLSSLRPEVRVARPSLRLIPSVRIVSLRNSVRDADREQDGSPDITRGLCFSPPRNRGPKGTKRDPKGKYWHSQVRSQGIYKKYLPGSGWRP